jgi:cytoskeleton protein RodZ
MFDIGLSLAAARRAQGLGLAEVEALTCIRQRNLTALEDEQFGLLPGRAYARAFLRTYASALGLEADRFVAEFERRYPEPDQVETPALRPRRRRELPVRSFVVVGSIAAVIGFVAWSGNSQPAPLAPFRTVAPAEAAPLPVRRATRPRAATVAAVDRRLVIHATGGPCWLVVRRGGGTGPVLYEATLRAGQTIRFAAPKVWIRLGAPGNVSIRRSGRSVGGLSGTTPENLVA